MKNTFLIAIAIMALISGLQAQPIIVGLNNNQSTGLASVIRWDAGTGTILDSVVTTQPGSVMGSSAFDATNQNYYFDGSFKICRIGFNPTSFAEIANSGITSSTEIDMANGKIYSVRSVGIYDTLGAYIGSQTEFVRYNIADSTEIVMGVMPSILGYYLDVNCYNSNAGTYYFIGVDSLGASVLVAIPTRSTIFSPRLMPLNAPPGDLYTLEYDNTDDILYGLSSSGVLSWHLQIKQIDTLTGAMTLKADLPQFVGYLMTTTSYDQASSSMIMVAIDTNQNYLLCNYAMQSNVLSTLLAPYAGEFYELECDNSQYAGVKYGQVTAESPSRSTEQLSVFPNPTHDVLRFTSANAITELSLIDAMGKTLPLSNNWMNGEIDLRKFAPGCYTLLAKGDNGIWMQTKVIKQ